MIDLKEIRENLETIQKQLQKRDESIQLSPILELDRQNRQLMTKLDELRRQKKDLSNQQKKDPNGTKAIANKADLARLGKEIKELEPRQQAVKKELTRELLNLPNIPHPSVVPGGKEQNQVLRVEGKKPEFPFPKKDHVTLSETHGLVDYRRGVKLGGNGSWVYRGMGARLEWALLNYFLDKHTQKGYEQLMPPHMLNYENGTAAGQFPKFSDEVYFLDQKKFLIPTAETALVNLYRDEIINEDELPLKLCAYTPCYRVESGSYRKSERGTLRGHQFNKVEMFQFTLPQDSETALQEMIEQAETIIQELGLHYRVSNLAAGDCAFAMARTVDLEVWIPSIEEYKEVSSASIAGDFQARRANIRYRNPATGKPDYVHTLNASGLATSRLVPAMLEQFQQKNGNVQIPEVLQPYLGKEVLEVVYNK